MLHKKVGGEGTLNGNVSTTSDEAKHVVTITISGSICDWTRTIMLRVEQFIFRFLDISDKPDDINDSTPSNHSIYQVSVHDDRFVFFLTLLNFQC